MIVGKHSALIGFGLFLYALVTLVLLFVTIQMSAVVLIAGALNTLANGYVIYKVYNHFKIKE